MAQTKEKTKDDAGAHSAGAADLSDRDAGRAGDQGAGAAEQLPAGTRVPVVLTKNNLRNIGRTLNGAHWQSDVAALIGCSKSQVTRFLNGQRELNPLISQHLQYVICERIVQLAELLHVEGMPYEGTVEADEFITDIKTLVERVPGLEPPRDR